MKELNQHVFNLFEKQEGNDKFLKSILTISDKYWHSVNLSTVKPMPEAYLESSQTSAIKFSCDFYKEALP